MTPDEDPREAAPPPPRPERDLARDPVLIEGQAIPETSGEAAAAADAGAPQEPVGEAAPAKPQSRAGLLIAVAVVALALAAGGAWWAGLLPGSDNGEPAPATSNGPPPVAEAPKPGQQGAQETPAAAPEAVRKTAQQAPSAPDLPPAPPLPPAPAPAIILPAETLGALDGRVAALETALRDRPAPAPPPDLQPLRDRFAALDKRLGAIEAQLAAPKTQARATEEPDALAAKKPNPAALAAVAQAIAQALDRGAPFASALAAAQTLGAPAEALAPLRAIADEGAADAAALRRQFDARKIAVLDAADPARADASLADRLKQAATRLVRVTPAAEAVGDTPPALAAQIDAALARGAIGAALAAWTKLPAAAQAAAPSFGDALRRRGAADQAAAALSDRAMQALAQTGAAP